MLKEGEKKPHVERRPGNRVSSAVWPLNVQRVVATGRAAQRRRDWIIQGRRWATLTDALPMRLLLATTTLLVVACSLLVAALGLRFWFLLPPPLLCFLAVLALPLLPVRRVVPETLPSPISGPGQEPHSSTGLLSPHPQEPHSSPGFQQNLESSAGLLASEAPATPMPAGQPLVRVLKTYDLRQPHTRQQLTEATRQDREQRRTLLATAAIEPLDEHEIPEPGR